MTRPTFSIGEIALYWEPESSNHRKDVLIIGKYEAGVLVRNSWTGQVDKLDGHEIARDGHLEFGPKAHVRARVFAAIQYLRKKKPPGAVRKLTAAQMRPRAASDPVVGIGAPVQEMEEA